MKNRRWLGTVGARRGCDYPTWAVWAVFNDTICSDEVMRRTGGGWMARARKQTRGQACYGSALRMVSTAAVSFLDAILKDALGHMMHVRSIVCKCHRNFAWIWKHSGVETYSEVTKKRELSSYRMFLSGHCQPTYVDCKWLCGIWVSKVRCFPRRFAHPHDGAARFSTKGSAIDRFCEGVRFSIRSQIPVLRIVTVAKMLKNLSTYVLMKLLSCRL